MRGAKHFGYRIPLSRRNALGGLISDSAVFKYVAEVLHLVVNTQESKRRVPCDPESLRRLNIAPRSLSFAKKAGRAEEAPRNGHARAGREKRAIRATRQAMLKREQSLKEGGEGGCRVSRETSCPRLCVATIGDPET